MGTGGSSLMRMDVLSARVMRMALGRTARVDDMILRIDDIGRGACR
jgi:hypothetical protein